MKNSIRASCLLQMLHSPSFFSLMALCFFHGVPIPSHASEYCAFVAIPCENILFISSNEVLKPTLADIMKCFTARW